MPTAIAATVPPAMACAGRTTGQSRTTAVVIAMPRPSRTPARPAEH
ncbi:hypothetical protein NE235_36035 [Actinoallomurus spadix]|nr:hypothetical protein [Actinoallomurus spadix]MCO5991539.1 hypothetical protein [Actinoallomurus spadix]